MEHMSLFRNCKHWRLIRIEIPLPALVAPGRRGAKAEPTAAAARVPPCAGAAGPAGLAAPGLSLRQ
jgi:hypothetical protein